MYLSYDEYLEYGGTLEETAFEQFEFEARSIIDWWTFDRLQNDNIYPEAVKRCMFKLISLLVDKQQALIVNPKTSSGSIQAGIIHEANDGVATDYNTLSANEAIETLQKQMQDIIRFYLSAVRNSLGHKLLYRGVYPNESGKAQQSSKRKILYRVIEE